MLLLFFIVYEEVEVCIVKGVCLWLYSWEERERRLVLGFVFFGGS